MLLSAVLIVRDEATFLPGCLASLTGLADEVVVVDTGSTDGTPAIARAHGALVADHPWTGDFAAARNRSLELASGTWVLYIDADERVRPGDHEAARRWLEAADGCVAARVRFVPRVGWTPYREFRVWRRRPDITFVGAMHETVVPSIASVSRSTGLAIEALDLLTIDHLGYEGDQAHKYERDEPLLLDELRRRPHVAYLHDHLARVREGRGDHEGAVAAWRAGIEASRRRPGGATTPDDLLLHVNLIVHQLAVGAVDDELRALVAEALDRFDRTPTIELAAGRLELADGDPASAAARARWLLDLDPDAVIDTGSSYDGRVFGEWAWDLLGSARFALGDDEGAADAFREAEALAPHDPGHRVRRRLAEARAAAGRSS